MRLNNNVLSHGCVFVYLCICVFVYLCTRDHVIMYLEANQCAFPWNNFKLGNRLGLKRSICDKLN